MDIVRATTADIPFIMATERLPGNEGLVGRFERDEHERALADASNAYFIGSIGGKPVGFVIVQHWAAQRGGTLIRRIIVAETGKRIGRALLSKVVDVTFAETKAPWLWLNVRPNNIRAQRSYGSLGFRFEPRAKVPEAGESQALLMMLRRDEWRRSDGSC